jgi:DNA polymerase-4
MSAPSSKSHFPRAILHFDGDSFFSSVEQAMDYRLRGKPIITGAERGAATSLSYEAKTRGLYRGMTLREIQIRCPEAILVTSDYISYAIYAHRMYSIVRSFTSIVEEYSIDECFADITGLEEKYNLSYEEIARMIKNELETALGITFGVGLAPTKTLAKAASKAHKPAGFTSVPLTEVPHFLEDLPIRSIWGLGGATGKNLATLGAETASMFAAKSDAWLSQYRLGKTYRDIWLELNGHYINVLNARASTAAGSVMVTRTFKPPSDDRQFILSQLSKNIEHACEKLRHMDAQAKALTFYLKTQEFTYHSVSLELTVPIGSPNQVLQIIQPHLNKVYAPGVLYRASGITLRSFTSNRAVIPDLFGETVEAEKKSIVFGEVDKLNKRYGKQTVFLGSSLRAISHTEDSAGRKSKNTHPGRARLFLGPGQKNKTLQIPYLGVVT